MIKQIEKDGHIIEYCTECERETDEACKTCNKYRSMFSQDITGQTYYHGNREVDPWLIMR